MQASFETRPSLALCREAAQKQLQENVYLFTHEFLMDHRSELFAAFEAKHRDGEYSIESALHGGAWIDVESFTNHAFTDEHVQAFLVATTPAQRDFLRKAVQDKGLPGSEAHINAYFYEEVVEEALAGFLAELDDQGASSLPSARDMAEPESTPIWGRSLNIAATQSVRNWTTFDPDQHNAS